jgi:hypothetical protein
MFRLCKLKINCNQSVYPCHGWCIFYVSCHRCAVTDSLTYMLCYTVTSLTTDYTYYYL